MRVMRAVTPRFNFRDLPIIRGCDGEGEGSGGGGNEDEEEEEDEEEDEENKNKDGDTEGLKSALRKERRDRKAAEKEAKRLQREAEGKTQKETDDLETARQQASESTSKAERLATKLADRSLDDAIFRAATGMKFLDADDAVTMLDRSEIEWDQDEDDPTKVTIDKDSVKEALEALKKRKPHLMAAEAGKGEEGGPTGSSFGGSRGNRKPNKEKEQEGKKETDAYPALGRRIGR